jgi:hypothetical protein
MKRRAGLFQVVGALSIATIVAAAWIARLAAVEGLSTSHCATYPGNCTYIVPFPHRSFHYTP